MVYGNVEHSVVFTGVYIDKGVEIKDSIIMPYSSIYRNSRIGSTIIAESAVIEEECEIGWADGDNFRGISVIGENVVIPRGTQIRNCKMVDDVRHLKMFVKDERMGGKAI
jgi:glucose-1-phosphate adenylyltransferase